MTVRLISHKKFMRWLVAGCYSIAFDGSQQAVRRDQVGSEWLQRRINAGEGNEGVQSYVYVLEASLAFPNGVTFILMSEFLTCAEGDSSNDKQNCGTKAFHRLACRFKDAFPRLPIMLLLDGLYPNGPVLYNFRKNRWQCVIVLQDDLLASV